MRRKPTTRKNDWNRHFWYGLTQKFMRSSMIKKRSSKLFPSLSNLYPGYPLTRLQYFENITIPWCWTYSKIVQVSVHYSVSRMWLLLIVVFMEQKDKESLFMYPIDQGGAFQPSVSVVICGITCLLSRVNRPELSYSKVHKLCMYMNKCLSLPYCNSISLES